MKTHRFDPVSFVAGALFTTLGLVAAFGAFEDLDNLRLGWPALLIAAGLLLVVSTIRTTREAKEQVDDVLTGTDQELGTVLDEVDDDLDGMFAQSAPDPDDRDG